MAAMKPKGGQPGGPDLAAALLAAHGGDVHAMMRTLTAGIAPPGAADADELRPRFAARPRPMAPVIFRLRVDIDDAKPPIWRRLDLAGDLTLAQVHRAIQAVFGWQDCHLHAFTPEVEGARDWSAACFANAQLDDIDVYRPEEQVRLDEVVSRGGDRLLYTYDFGDAWQHTLKVEEVRPRGKGPSAVCVGGRRAGPMEDCGGIWRYNELVAALSGRESMLEDDEIAEVRDWYGGDFDPADADLDPPEDLDSVVFGRPGVGSFLHPDIEIVVDDQLAPDAIAIDLEAVSPLTGNPRLAPAFAHLVDIAEDAGVLPTLDELSAAADLDVTSEPAGASRAAVFAGLSRAEAEATTEPWRALVRSLGTAGAQVTTDGAAARPSLASEDVLFPVDELVSTDVPRPDLVRAARALGLVRKKGDRVYATRAGLDAAGDPIRMWRHLADRMAGVRGRDDSLVGPLALLAIGGDRPARATFADLTEHLMPPLAWGGPLMSPSVEAAFASTEHVWAVMDECDGFAPDGRPTVPARRLARVALLTS